MQFINHKFDKLGLSNDKLGLSNSIVYEKRSAVQPATCVYSNITCVGTFIGTGKSPDGHVFTAKIRPLLSAHCRHSFATNEAEVIEHGSSLSVCIIQPNRSQ